MVNLFYSTKLWALQKNSLQVASWIIFISMLLTIAFVLLSVIFTGFCVNLHMHRLYTYTPNLLVFLSYRTLKHDIASNK